MHHVARETANEQWEEANGNTSCHAATRCWPLSVHSPFADSSICSFSLRTKNLRCEWIKSCDSLVFIRLDRQRRQIEYDLVWYLYHSSISDMNVSCLDLHTCILRSFVFHLSADKDLCRVEWGNSDHSEKKSSHFDDILADPRRTKVNFLPQVEQSFLYPVMQKNQRSDLFSLCYLIFAESSVRSIRITPCEIAWWFE